MKRERIWQNGNVRRLSGINRNQPMTDKIDNDSNRFPVLFALWLAIFSANDNPREQKAPAFIELKK